MLTKNNKLISYKNKEENQIRPVQIKICQNNGYKTDSKLNFYAAKVLREAASMEGQMVDL